MLLLKFLTNRFKSIGSSFRKSKEVSFTNSTVLLAFTELFMVVVGILLALYIDRWNSTQKHEEQFKATLRLVQQDLESDVFASDNVIAGFSSRDSLRHNVMLNKLDRNYYENGISGWEKIIAYYNNFNVSLEGFNLLIDMKEEVPDKYVNIYKKIKNFYKRIETINEYNSRYKEVIWDIKDELSFKKWYWIDSYDGIISEEQIDFYLNDFYYKSLVQKTMNASVLLYSEARNHRIKAINLYHEINDLLGIEVEVPKNIKNNLADSLANKYVGTYKLIEGDNDNWFPKYYSENLILEIGIKDSILYLMQDNEHSTKLYYFNRISNNSKFPIKKHPVFISSIGFFEFYKNGNLKVGAAGPYSIWEKQ